MQQDEIFGKQSKWLEFPDGRKHPYPLVRKDFTLQKVQKAELTVCGLGFFECYLNGQRVGNYFKPVVSDYLDRDFSHFGYPLFDKTSHRVYAVRYDVTDFLQSGKNALCFLLASGIFDHTKRLCEGDCRFHSSLFLRFSLQCTIDGETVEIFSDRSCRSFPSHIIESDLYYGEKQDLRKYNRQLYLPEYEPKQGMPCTESTFPDVPFYLQPIPSESVEKVLHPKKIKTILGWTLYDAGENTTGWATVKGKGNIHILYVENINKLLRPDPDHPGSPRQRQIDTFYRTNGETMHPLFRWNAFRYFYVLGKVSEIEVEVIHPPFEQIATFETDNKVLNGLFDIYLRTQLNNMHMGIPSDCPHRERLGYTCDGQLTTESALLTLDTRAFYQKWFADILDCQDIKSGHVQHTAPLMGGGGGPGAWGGAIILAPYRYYSANKDVTYIKSLLPAMQRWIEYTKNNNFGIQDKSYLIVKECDKGWCLGDWCTLEKIAIPEPFVNTCVFVKALQEYKEMCLACGTSSPYDGLAESCKEAIRKNYFNPRTKRFCSSVQGADFFAYDIGLLTKEEIEPVICEYAERNYFDTGIVGTELVVKTCFETGHGEEGTKLLCSEEKGSYGYMLAQGATTLWEYWDGKKSQNHPMFGSVITYLFRGVAGIEYTPGFEKILIKPTLFAGLKNLQCTITRPHVSLSVRYTQSEGKQTFSISYSGSAVVQVLLHGDTVPLTPNREYLFENRL